LRRAGSLQQPPASGKRSYLEEERRQITVLFCDMVGSTEMSGRLDIEDYREVVQLYQQTVAAAIATFSGHVAQYLGDGVVAYFGWPLAYGDDAERAVRAGLEILEALNRLSPGLHDDRKIAARVGIHTGPVLVAKIGIGPGHEVAALGETPNVASRAQGFAPPDSVVITGATMRLIGRRFVGEPLGNHPLKGVAQPVALYRVRRATETRKPQYAGREARPFVGREAELKALHEIWAKVERGVACSVTLKGEAGIGKSRLVRHFRASLRDKPHGWFAVVCSPFSINTPFAPVMGFINRGAQSATEALTRIQSALVSAGIELEHAIPAIAEMLGLPIPDGYTPLLSSPEQKRRRFISVVSEWLLARARNQPAVIVIEDAQWADPSTLDLAAHLLEHGAAQPIMLIYEARPEFGAPAMRDATQAELELARLSHEDTLVLIRGSKWSVKLPVEAVELVADRSGGVPLFVEELASEMADRGGDAAANSQIPATLADSLMARLDRLGAAKEIAQIAAIIGREFSYPMLHAIAERSPSELDASLERLLAADVINTRGNPPEARYTFKHALVRDAAYDSLLRSRRRVLHGAVARAMAERQPHAGREAERLAYHLSEAGDADAASRAWQTAGDAASRRGALAEAASHYAKALEMLAALQHPARDQREMSILMTLASVLSASKGLASTETEETYRRARELGSRLHPDRATALLGLWQMHVTRGEAIAAQDLADQRLKIAQLERTPSALCRSHLAVGMTLFHRGKIAGSIEHLRAAVECYAEGQSRAALFDAGPLAMAYLAVALGLAAREDEARAMSTRSLDAAELLQSPPTIAFCRVNAAALHWSLGEPHEVLRIASAGVDFARAHDLEQMACGLEVYVGWATAATGDAAAGAEQIRKAIGGWLANGQRLPHAWFLSFLAWASAMAGRTAAALETIDEAEAAVGEMLLEETIVWSMRAEILALSGAEREVVEAAWRKVIDSARRNDASLFEARAVAALAKMIDQDSAPLSTYVTLTAPSQPLDAGLEPPVPDRAKYPQPRE
jgi:class 3 adenylate cyclase/tetratricopeptide (TPR) repeat protein